MYIAQWFEESILAYVPTDLNLTKGILGYHNNVLQKACFVVIGHHFWYLSEHLLSLLDSQLPAFVKHEDGDVFLNMEGTAEPRKQIIISDAMQPTASFTSFTMKTSLLHLLDDLGIQRDFLSHTHNDGMKRSPTWKLATTSTDYSL